jgi:hypothetical protein
VGVARRAFLCLMLAASLAGSVGCDGHTTNNSAQALRTCVDRWNQGNMLGWGPAFVSISIRRLGTAELAALGLRNPARPRCVVSIAFESRRDPRTGCPPGVTAPAKPGWCVDRTGTFDCAINPFGAYSCPLIHEPTGAPLRKKNATTDARGVLRLDVPLKAAQATPRLAWQRRYPHTDGWIEPWTGQGRLRPGVSFAGRGHGPCPGRAEARYPESAIRCLAPPAGGIVSPCFPSRRPWRPGDLAACATVPGEATFTRWVITRGL